MFFLQILIGVGIAGSLYLALNRQNNAWIFVAIALITALVIVSVYSVR